MNLQKRLAAKILNCSPKKIRLEPEQAAIIKDAITKADVRSMISKGHITRHPDTGISRGRLRKTQAQRRKGRQRGSGSRKGSKYARTNRKSTWMATIRLQRAFLKRLKDNNKITTELYRTMYNRAKGGFFRSERHLKLYLKEQGHLK